MQMTPDKNAPLAVFLASDAAKDVTGQIFAPRMNELFVFSQTARSSVHRSEGWTPEAIAEYALPALRRASRRSSAPATCSAGTRSEASTHAAGAGPGAWLSRLRCRLRPAAAAGARGLGPVLAQGAPRRSDAA